jgi:serine/threonine protein kinase
MWALGIVLANVLGGSGIRMSLLGSHDKMIFAEADDRVIWRKLNKLPVALKEGRVPDQWTEVMDLLRSLTRLNPHERMTAAEVLQHPFLKKADKLPRLYSS